MNVMVDVAKILTATGALSWSRAWNTAASLPAETQPCRLPRMPRLSMRYSVMRVRLSSTRPDVAMSAARSDARPFSFAPEPAPPTRVAMAESRWCSHLCSIWRALSACALYFLSSSISDGIRWAYSWLRTRGEKLPSPHSPL